MSFYSPPLNARPHTAKMCCWTLSALNIYFRPMRFLLLPSTKAILVVAKRRSTWLDPEPPLARGEQLIAMAGRSRAGKKQQQARQIISRATSEQPFMRTLVLRLQDRLCRMRLASAQFK
ncbi:uncharacterized protein CLUP02_13586 [Colletotrichum lupini]|uniref:Uncharacterized protein n=1 Tax=Colletotrichum lupini TaxID=145971 RepID=A0A9Q8T2F8_9PEZI|nr:uncharacterized protein CLUP02_13586 [Colletotrichum lupini]UQC88064.1 hypothetical protein CLUP02_13586 [Colletotrichum lupini]